MQNNENIKLYWEKGKKKEEEKKIVMIYIDNIKIND